MSSAGGKRLRRLSWTIGAVILVIGAVLAVVNQPLFLRFLSLFGTLLLVFSVLIMLLIFRKSKKLSTASLLISMAVSLLALVVYTGLMEVTVNRLIMVLGLLAGGSMGVVWAFTIKLSLEGGAIKRQGNLWYLAIWGLLFASTQVITLVTGRPPEIALALLLIGTGLVFGQSGTLILRANQLLAASLGKG